MALPARPRPRRGVWSAVTAVAAIALVAAASLLVHMLPSDSEPRFVAAPQEPHLVFAQFGLNEDRVYVAPAGEPNARVDVAVVAHAPGWGIQPAAGLAGSLVAYNVLPEDAAPDSATPAELWVIDVDTREQVRLARDADLLVAPVFVEGGAGLIYRRTDGRQQEIVRIAIAERTRKVLHAEQTDFGIFPIGSDDLGGLLFARLSTGGTDIYSVRDGVAPALVFHASDHVARDWQLSPDGNELSYLAPEVADERVSYRAHVFNLREAKEVALTDTTPDAPTEQYAPVWTPDGSGLTVGQEAFVRSAEPAVVLGRDGSLDALPAPAQGFDVPLGWSGDGRFLAVRWFDGRNSTQPGLDATVIVDREGGRTALDVPTEVIFIGWYAGV